jgi:3-methyladenine DNA glycosylase/8-oxoguanine DNA glycosylase
MARSLWTAVPPGFDFRATVEALRRGPADPVNWFDGRRWRRVFTLQSCAFLLEASWTDRLVLRTLAGAAPADLAKHAALRALGLDDPGRALVRSLPSSLRGVVRRVAGVLLPGYPSLFEALVQTVLGQQLAASVAHRQRTAFVRAFGRCYRICGQDYWTFPPPTALARVPPRRIQALGISRVKAHAIRAIARRVDVGSLSEERLRHLSVADAIRTLTELPGVGPWTSEWVLLRGLRRFEVVPAGDLAIRKAVGWYLGAPGIPAEAEVRDAASAWFPYGGLVVYRLLHANRLALG